jgi:hypothetical protein
MQLPKAVKDEISRRYAEARGISLASARRTVNRYLTTAKQQRGRVRPNPELVKQMEEVLRCEEQKHVEIFYVAPPIPYEESEEERVLTGVNLRQAVERVIDIAEQYPSQVARYRIHDIVKKTVSASDLRAIRRALDDYAARTQQYEEELEDRTFGLSHIAIYNVACPIRVKERVVSPIQVWRVVLTFWHALSP